MEVKISACVVRQQQQQQHSSTASRMQDRDVLILSVSITCGDRRHPITYLHKQDFLFHTEEILLLRNSMILQRTDCITTAPLLKPRMLNLR